MRIIMLIVASCLLAACVTTGGKTHYIPKTESFSVPPLNLPSTASVGESMLQQGNRSDREAVRLLSEAEYRFGFTKITFQPGVYLKTGSKDEWTYLRPADLSERSGSSVVFGAASRQDLVTQYDVPSLVADFKRKRFCTSKLDIPVECAKGANFQPTTVSIVSANNFQQTLIYNGRVGDRINVGYREFQRDLLRPAFSNSVEYDLSKSDVISYQGARLKIIEADNNRVEYEVLSNFN